MNLYLAVWRYTVILLLNVSIQRSLLLPASSLELRRFCDLTVDQASPVRLGSDLTARCNTRDSQWRLKWREISLEVNHQAVTLQRELDNTTTIFGPTAAQDVKISLYCKLKGKSRTKWLICDERYLTAGFPPDKPENISCETTNASAFIECSWARGRETHLRTTYGVSLFRENGTLVASWSRNASDVAVSRGMLTDNTKYRLVVTAHNQLGDSQSDPFPFFFRDLVIPEAPVIRQVRFANGSLAAVLRWETNDSLPHVTSHLAIHQEDGPREAREATRLGERLIRVDGLLPLTLYTFQIKICNSTPALPRTSGERPRCSKWSTPVTRRSPGKGPSQLAHVWRRLSNWVSNTTREVLVLWKPLPPDDHSGDVLEYKILLGDDRRQEVSCPAGGATECLVRVPAGLEALGVSVVTPYGTSTPAPVPLALSGAPGPALRETSPTAGGTALLVRWSPGETAGERSHYVVEWAGVPAAGLQWKHVSGEQNSTVITGLAAGVRYNVSLYAVTTRGVSAPSSRLTYSEELKPVSGPSVSVLARERGRVLIRWDELAVEQQRGFITNYTIYIQTLDPENSERSVVVPASGPREMWLDCPDGAVALQMTATNSAGEGQRGGLFSQPAAPGVGLLVIVVFVGVLFVGVVGNLMSWSCVRKRVKQRCMSWTPDWLVRDVPKLGNSTAIRLLEQDGREPLFSCSQDDPPLSPISCVSHDAVYPNMHMEAHHSSAADDISYKPQAAAISPPAKEEEEEDEEAAAAAEEHERRSLEEDPPRCGGLLLSSVEVGSLNLPAAACGGFACDFLWPATLETTVSGRGDSPGNSGIGEEPDAAPAVGSQQGTAAPEQGEASSFPCPVEAALSNGYFPQISAVR